MPIVSLVFFAFFTLWAAPPQSSAAPPAAHSREFWQSLAKAKYVPSPDADVPALVRELTDMLGAPDPELRDDIAYSTLTAWIYQQKRLDAAAISRLTEVLETNLRTGIGSVGSDAVLRRSFSALILSVVVARDNADPVLSETAFRDLLEAALTYLAAEKDVRGYDDSKGWMHSAAHTADLLKFLGRSRFLRPADAGRILDAVAQKLTASAIFAFGEDERLARAALSIVNRADFDGQVFDDWTKRAKPAPVRAEKPTTAQLQSAQNVKNFFAKLEVLLSVDAQPPDRIRAARDSVRSAMKDAF